MTNRSPPKHRHDGTSPLPLGMDWSPPPCNWNGRDTVWPHDPRSGWSYCVMIPKWEVIPEAKSTDGTLINPVVFYRVLVGIQSPNGITSSRSILRRFNDFLKLASALKRSFPSKHLPSAPPKHSFLRVSSSASFVQERQRALGEWLGSLLLDIDIARSAPVASFLELEAAARFAIAEMNESQEPSKSGLQLSADHATSITTNFGQVHDSGSSLVTHRNSSSVVDYGSDSTNEVSDMESIRQGKEHELDHDSDIAALDHIPLRSGEFVMKLDISDDEQASVDMYGGSLHREGIVGVSQMTNRNDNIFEGEHGYEALHMYKYSHESNESETGSIRGSETSNLGTAASLTDGTDGLGSVDAKLLNDVQLVLPSNDRKKIRRVILTLQRQLVTAKTDMEDLRARWNQEIAAKDFLTIKVKDLEGELENAQNKSRETLQQAVLLERGQVTQLQWDLEDMRRKAIEVEEQYKKEKVSRCDLEAKMQQKDLEKGKLQQEVFHLKEQIGRMQKDHERTETKTKTELKVLAKELRMMRKLQPVLKEELEVSKKAKSELEAMLQKEQKKQEWATRVRAKLIHEATILRKRLEECSVDVLTNLDKQPKDEFSLSDAMGLLATSDNRIGLLLAEAQLLAQQDEYHVDMTERSGSDEGGQINGNGHNINLAESSDNRRTNSGATEAMVRKILTDVLIDNAQLRKNINSAMRSIMSHKNSEKEEAGDAPKSSSILNKFLEK